MLRTEKRENIQSFLSKMTSLKQPLIKNYKYDKGWRLNLTTWKRSMQRFVGGAVVSLHFQYLHKSKRNRLPLSFTRAWHFHSDQFPLASHCPSLSFHVQSIKKILPALFSVYPESQYFSSLSQLKVLSTPCLNSSLHSSHTSTTTSPSLHFILESVTF